MDLKIFIIESKKESKKVNIFDDLEKAKTFYRNILTEIKNNRYEGKVDMEICDLDVHY